MAYFPTREFPRFYPIYHKLAPVTNTPQHFPKFQITPPGFGNFRIGGGITLGTVAFVGVAGALAYWLWMKATETPADVAHYQRHRLRTAGPGPIL